MRPRSTTGSAPPAEAERYLATSCAWCGKMRRPCGEWIQVPTVVAQSLSVPAEGVAVTHGVCPPCADSVFGDL